MSAFRSGPASDIFRGVSLAVEDLNMGFSRFPQVKSVDQLHVFIYTFILVYPVILYLHPTSCSSRFGSRLAPVSWHPLPRRWSTFDGFHVAPCIETKGILCFISGLGAWDPHLLTHDLSILSSLSCHYLSSYPAKGCLLSTQPQTLSQWWRRKSSASKQPHVWNIQWWLLQWRKKWP